MNVTPVTNIYVGDRFREELGDIDALAESIKTHGLLHPLVLTVDEEQRYTLVAGFRRLNAVKQLGWECVPYTLLEALTVREVREIELQENIRRKDFTEYELSKARTTLYEVIEERLIEEAEKRLNLGENRPEEIEESNPIEEADSRDDFCLTVRQKPQGGRPVGSGKPNNIRAIAEEAGVDKQTVTNDRAHVAAVEAHPELKDVPKMNAIHAAKTAAKLPEPRAKEYIENSVAYHTGKSVPRKPISSAPDPEVNHRAVDKQIIDATSGSLFSKVIPQTIDNYLNLMRCDHEEIADMVRNLGANIERMRGIRDYLQSKLRPTIIRGGRT